MKLHRLLIGLGGSPVSQPDAQLEARLAPVLGHRAAAELARFAGSELFDGVLTIHTGATAERADLLIREALPRVAADAACFAQDWQGSQFAATRNGTAVCVAAEGEVYLAPPVPGLLSEIGRTATLDADVYHSWLAQGGSRATLDRCIGMKVPPALGGSFELSNLEDSDVEVYWAIMGQIAGH